MPTRWYDQLVAVRSLVALVLLVALPIAAQSPEPLKVGTVGSTVGGAIRPADSPGHFFFRNHEGNPDGLEYKVLKYFAESQGRELEIVWVDDFFELLPAVESGLIDIAAGSITVTPERDQTVDFSKSYFPLRVMLVEPNDQATTSIAALAGKRVGSSLNLNPDLVFKAETAGVPGLEIVYPGDGQNLWDLLDAGKIDGFVAETATVIPTLEENSGVHLTLVLGEEQHFGFAVRTGSPLREELDSHLRLLKQSGIYYRLLERYFGKEAARLLKRMLEPGR